MRARKTACHPACWLLWLLVPVASVRLRLKRRRRFSPRLKPEEAARPATRPAAEPEVCRQSRKWIQPDLDLGYRWNAGLRGSEDLYRTLVNLGEGPRLFGANLTMNSPLGAGKYHRSTSAQCSAWGRVGILIILFASFAEKAGTYQFSFDYRKVDYFDFIPSFANPLLGQGILLGQHSFDSTRRTMDFNLTLRPGTTISPFLAYSRNSGFGPGVTRLLAMDQFAVHNQLRDSSDYYRGGVIFNLPQPLSPSSKAFYL